MPPPRLLLLTLLVVVSGPALAEWIPGPSPQCQISPDSPKVLAGQKITFIAMGGDVDMFMPGYQSGFGPLDTDSASWTASARTPTSGSGRTFEWTAPDSATSVTISVTVPDQATLADDPGDAQDQTTATAMVPTVVAVRFVD